MSLDPARRQAVCRAARAGLERWDSVRDETAAYPQGSGPRTVFVVRAGGRRYRLVHLIRDRCWTLEEIGAQAAGLSRAA